MRDYKKLEIWKMAIEVVKAVYNLTKGFPKEELYALTSQVRRAAISIPSNISEGCGKETDKHFILFLHNSMGSLKEVECQIFISRELRYINEDDFEKLTGELDLLGRKLIRFIKYLKEKDGK